LRNMRNGDGNGLAPVVKVTGTIATKPKIPIALARLRPQLTRDDPAPGSEPRRAAFERRSDHPNLRGRRAVGSLRSSIKPKETE
jgi:hypothetical protein